MEDVFFRELSWRTAVHGDDQVRSVLAATYDMDVREFGSSNASYSHRVVGTTDFAIGRSRLGGQLVAESLPLPFLCVVQLRSGRQSVSSMKQTHPRADATPFLFPRQARKVIQWDGPDLQQVILRQRSVEEELARLGLPPLRALDLGANPAPETRRMWEAAAEYARAAAESPELTQSDLVRTTVFRALVTALVTTFTSGALDRSSISRPDWSGTPATIRRALEFIDAHAQEPVTVADIALAAGIGSRGLQATFARHHGYSPMHALRQARLRGAHTDLVNARVEDGASVASVAAQWGFTNPSRFARQYRDLFGNTPSSSLHDG